MKKHVLTIGLLDRETKTQLVKTEDAMRIISDVCLSIGGATIIPGCIGIYTMDDGSIIREPSIQAIVYEFDAPKYDQVRSAAETIGKALNQESIAYECLEVAGALFEMDYKKELA